MSAFTMTQGQQEALAALREFVQGPAHSFMLDGFAGVGKTWLTSEFVRELLGTGRRVVLAAPTHKACRVLRGKLTAAGIPWVFKQQKGVRPDDGRALVDTTAALLGVKPVIVENQNSKQRHFGRGGRNPLPYVLDHRRPIIFVDEISMLGRDDLRHLLTDMRGLNPHAKFIGVGDAAQLPPVNHEAICFDQDFARRYTLRQVVRQAEGNAIIQFAHTIRNGGVWWKVTGPGIEHTDHLLDAYLDGLTAPVDDETQRRVFIAYENKIVDSVRMACSWRLYDHSPGEFRVGELVLADAPYKIPHKAQGIAPQEQLRILSLGNPDPAFFMLRQVRVERVDLGPEEDDRVIDGYYLTGAELEAKDHPYNQKLAALEKEAKHWAAAVRRRKVAGKGFQTEEELRREAWTVFFAHKEAVLHFVHPFAITAHKSQGSTYREAFIDAGNLSKYTDSALYVAATRPTTRLVWAGAPGFDPSVPELE